MLRRMSQSTASHVRVGGMLLVVGLVAAVVTVTWFVRPDSKPGMSPRPLKCQPHQAVKSTPAAGTLDRFYVVEDLAKLELAAGRLNEADALATELLELAPQHPRDWNYGNALHWGNTLRGQVALARGDVAEAKRRLLAAAATPGSPQLASFGPGMALAHGLLERGETAVVLEYMQLCRRFWKQDFGALDKWTAELRSARFPDLRPNACY